MIQSLICLYSPPLLCLIKGWLFTELLISMFLIFTLHFLKQIFHELFPSLLAEKKILGISSMILQISMM